MMIRLPKRIGLVRLSLMAVVVGVVTGAGAVFFRALIGVIHNAAFFGRFEIAYDASLFTPPSPWGAYVIPFPCLEGSSSHSWSRTSHRKRAAMACPKSWMRSITRRGSSGRSSRW